MIKITQKENCTGCYACKNICPEDCITMGSDFEGFRYPTVDIKSCVECGLCEKVCPIIHKKVIENNPKAYACYNKNEKTRMESSSGGLFTLIAEQIIDNGGIVFGALFDNEFNVIHDYVDIKENLSKLRGSKYVQSKIGDMHKKVKCDLLQGKQVLFTGTPCQIAGLKSYLQKDYDNLFCIDNICHGVPSPKVWQNYISYQEKYFKSSLSKINFRNKDTGWKDYSVYISFENNDEYKNKFNNDLYMKAFLKDICLRPSCYQCEFKSLHRQSDITLADYWGIQSMIPDMDDDKGTSLIFVNSERGQVMLEKIKAQILYREVDINKAVVYNPSAVKSSVRNPRREDFFKEIGKLQFEQLVKKYCIDSVAIRVKNKLKTLAYNIVKKVGLLNLCKKVLKRA